MLIDTPTEIVVEAPVLATPQSDRPLAITVIDSEELRSAGASGLDQILQRVAGLQLFRRSDARSANPTSQGVTLRSLGGNASSRALLLLDGVPQTDPFGGWINWPAYDSQALASVRVTRGGGSVGNGPGALAGTIALTSSTDVRADADLDVGSRSSLEGRVRGGASVAGGRISLSAHGSRGDGFIPITADTRGPVDQSAPFRNASARLRWYGPITSAVFAETALNGFVDQRSRGLPLSDNKSRGADVSLRVAGNGRWSWSALAYSQWREFESSFAAADPERIAARRTSLQYNVPGRSVGWSAEVRPPVAEELELRVGTDGRRMRGWSEELGSYVAGSPTRDRSSGGEVGHAGLFAEASWTTSALTLTAGARVDRLKISSGFYREQVIATGLLTRDVHYDSRTEWLGTGRLGARLALSPEVSLRTAAYMGWRPPTLNELFRPFRLGNDATAANADLRPERLAGVEAGLGWNKGRATLEVTVFRNRLRDPIANVTVGTGPGVFEQVGFVPAGGVFRQRQNLESIGVTGLETAASWGSGPFTLRGEASWSNARLKSDGAAATLSGLRPAQTPRFAASASADWNRKGYAAAMQVRYSGAQFEDDLNSIRLPATFTVDASIQVPLTSRLQLVGRAENLLNAQVLAARTADGVEERATPRTLWLGLRLNAG